MQFTFTTLLALATAVSAASTTSLSASLASTTSVSVASGCSFSKTQTITAQAQLDEFSSCEAIKGDIYITGDLGTAAIANVKAIYGDLTIYNATELTSFTADSIGSITGELTLEKLTILSELSLTGLSSVGALNWVTLPALTDTGLSQVSECNSVYISDTELSSLDGLNPVNVETFSVNNNKNLISIDSGIETISDSLSISYNGEDTAVEFSSLQWANNLTFYDVSSISMGSLQTINNSAGFFESYFEELKFPYVTKIGGDLTIENNDDLTELDFSNVTTIGGGLTIENNTKLDGIDGFDDLKSISGAVSLKGEFDNCTMSALKTVRGAFTVDTDGDFDCSTFESLYKSGGIQGDFKCSAKSETSTVAGTATSGSDSTSTSSGSDSDSTATSGSSSSSGVAGTIEPASVLGTLAAIFLAFA